MYILNIIGSLLIIVGLFVIFSGVIGIIRFPGFFNKIHAAGVIESCGVPLSLFGLALIQTNWTSVFKLILIMILILLLNPSSTHALSKVAKLLMKNEYINKQDYKN